MFLCAGVYVNTSVYEGEGLVEVFFIGVCFCLCLCVLVVVVVVVVVLGESEVFVWDVTGVGVELIVAVVEGGDVGLMMSAVVVVDVVVVVLVVVVVVVLV